MISIANSPSAAPATGARFLSGLNGLASLSYKAFGLSPFGFVRFFGALRTWYADQRSGRRSAVRRSASAWRHALTLAWSPEVSTSGIGSPSTNGGPGDRGGSRRPHTP